MKNFMYICNRFSVGNDKHTVANENALKKDSLVVFTHKFVNLRRKAPLRQSGLLF